MKFYMNLYASGHYHRKGKPGVTDVHGGDLYATEQQALYDAEPEKGYIGTFPIDLPAPFVSAHRIKANGQDSLPVPLSVSRQERAAMKLRLLSDYYATPAAAPRAATGYL